MKDVLVVGAGLSGLSAAWSLSQAGARVHVVEASSRPGGLIRTVTTPHGPYETAANAFVANAHVYELFRALGIAPLTPRATSRKRYIYRDGRPRRWPLSIAESAGVAGRFATSWLLRRVAAGEHETVAAWSDRVLGRAATRWMVGPALHGIYASPPQALSARAIAASRPKGTRVFIAPPGGMGEFIERLHGALVERGVTFAFDTPATDAMLDAARPTIVATNAPAAARLLARHAPAFARAAARVTLVPLSPVTAFFEPTAGDLRGFGVLFPRAAGMAALGVRFDTDIFDGRGALRTETWIYPGVIDSSSIGATLSADRERLTGHKATPVAIYPTIWTEGIPVYNEAVLDAAKALATLPPWLTVTGNYLGKLGVASLVEAAAEAAAPVYHSRVRAERRHRQTL